MAQREYMGGEAVDEDGTFRCIIHIVPIQEEPSLETLIKLGRGGDTLPQRCKVCEKQGRVKTSVWALWSGVPLPLY